MADTDGESSDLHKVFCQHLNIPFGADHLGDGIQIKSEISHHSSAQLFQGDPMVCLILHNSQLFPGIGDIPVNESADLVIDTVVGQNIAVAVKIPQGFLSL